MDEKIKIKDFYTNVGFENTIQLRYGFSELFDRCKESLIYFRFKILKEDKDKGILLAKTRFNIINSSQSVLILINKSGIVHIRSANNQPFRLHDWGKNKKNVDSILNRLVNQKNK